MLKTLGVFLVVVGGLVALGPTLSCLGDFMMLTSQGRESKRCLWTGGDHYLLSSIHVGGSVQKNRTLRLLVQNHGTAAVQVVDAHLWLMRSALPAVRVCKKPVPFTVFERETLEWMCPIPQGDSSASLSENVCNAKLRGDMRIFVDQPGLFGASSLLTKTVQLDYPCFDFPEQYW